MVKVFKFDLKKRSPGSPGLSPRGSTHANLGNKLKYSTGGITMLCKIFEREYTETVVKSTPLRGCCHSLYLNVEGKN